MSTRWMCSVRTVVLGSLALGTLLPAAVSATGYATGADAIDVLGQLDDNLANPGPVFDKYMTNPINNGPNKLGLNHAFFVAVDTTYNRLFVTDTSNNRILVYGLNAQNDLIDRVPDIVIGQPNFYSGKQATTISGMRFPTALAFDSNHNRLFVGDGANNRILAFDASALSNGMSASYVIGQSSFTSSGAATTQAGARYPYGLSYDATSNRLFATEYQNNRVVAYSGSSISTGMNAAFVLGQASFTTSGSAVTQSGMNTPLGVTADAASNRVYVSDYANNRVLVFTGSQLSNGVNAAKVLGQTSFTTNTSGVTQSKFTNPIAVAVDSAQSRVFVSDRTNFRILTYDLSSGINDGMSGSSVLGQSNFTNRVVAATQAGLWFMAGLAYDAGNKRLYALDSGNSRIMIYDVASVTTGENAVDVLGQYDGGITNPQPIFTKGGPNNISRGGLSLPYTVAADALHHRLFVADSSNNRVLVYALTSSNVINSHLPSYVLGQADSFNATAATTQAGMSLPRGLAYDSTHDRLFVADALNNRVLVYDTSALTTGMTATYVLGQSSFTAAAAATTQAGMIAPYGLLYDTQADHLFVSDTGNHRILVYSGASLSTGMTANTVLGQSDFITGSQATTQAGLNTPRFLAYDSTTRHLFVTDGGNNRVLVYSGSSLATGMNANTVIGQAGFTTATAALTASGFNSPTGVSFDTTHNRLFVSDYSNNRVLIFSGSTLRTGMTASAVLGQSSFTSNTARSTQSGLSTPMQVAYVASTNQLFVTDYSNYRILVFGDIVADSSSSSSSSSTGQSGGGGGGGGGGGVRRTTTVTSSSSSSKKSSSASSVSSRSSSVSSKKSTPILPASSLRDQRKLKRMQQQSMSPASTFPAAAPSSSSTNASTRARVNVRSYYSMNGAILTQLPANTPVEVIGTYQSWVQVRLPDGRTGYLLRSFLNK